MSVCVQSCPFALDRAPRVASDAIKRVTFGTEAAAFAIVWKSLQARVARGAIDSRAKRLFSAGILNTTEDLGVRDDEVPLYCSGMAPRRPPSDLRYPCRGFRQRPAQRAVFMRGWERDCAAARDLGVVRKASSTGVAQIGGGAARAHSAAV